MTQTADLSATADERPDRDSWLRRNQTWIKWLSVAAIVVAVLLFLRGLPVQDGVDRLAGVIERYGVWGYALFGAIYVVAALLLIPGAALSLAAGAVFGLGGGFVTVVISATVAAGAAFVIARYLARDKVRKSAENSRTFGAIDAAVGEGGWKVVGLLRLSPAVPFSVSNYLFGLTPVALLPYAAATLVGIMPGTLLYVYLGTLAKRAAGGGSSGGVWTYVFYGVGLLATLAVTVYLTHLARKKLKESTDVIEDKKEKRRPPVGWATYILPLVALLAVAAVPFRGYAAAKLVALAGGPPQVTPKEAYDKGDPSVTFDHSAFDAVLKKHVDAEGFVDYPRPQGRPRRTRRLRQDPRRRPLRQARPRRETRPAAQRLQRLHARVDPEPLPGQVDPRHRPAVGPARLHARRREGHAQRDRAPAHPPEVRRAARPPRPSSAPRSVAPSSATRRTPARSSTPSSPTSQTTA